MSVLTLTRSDPAQNLHRYYRLDVHPDLFGAWCFVREWGRLGRAGQMRIVPYPAANPGAGAGHTAEEVYD
jgi:predicted DNA-binding WGR domain protein